MSALSNDEKNQRIAEACGWTDIREQDYCEAHINPYEGPVLQYWEGVSPNGEKGPLPDYTGDLNAIAEARDQLTPDQLTDYLMTLERIARSSPPKLWRDISPARVIDYCLEAATAEQRANALGITLGLWKEGE